MTPVRLDINIQSDLLHSMSSCVTLSHTSEAVRQSEPVYGASQTGYSYVTLTHTVEPVRQSEPVYGASQTGY